MMTTLQRNAIGTVATLWRYPVKSMMGEELNAADVTARGLDGDRLYAVIDQATGKVASAKNPKKWGRLFDCLARYAPALRQNQTPPSVHVLLPDGSMVLAEAEEAAKKLSAILGRTVRLAAAASNGAVLEEYWPDVDGRARRNVVTDETMPAGTFFDGAHLHLMTTATLDALRAAYPVGRFETRRFRPNLVVAPTSDERGFVENAWVDRTVMIGEEVILKVTGPCARCVMITLPQGDLPEDTGILRAAVQHNRSAVGVYATVVRPGRVQRGDQIRFA
jgi:uncharacterized protein YcbX